MPRYNRLPEYVALTALGAVVAYLIYDLHRRNQVERVAVPVRETRRVLVPVTGPRHPVLFNRFPQQRIDLTAGYRHPVPPDNRWMEYLPANILPAYQSMGQELDADRFEGLDVIDVVQGNYPKDQEHDSWRGQPLALSKIIARAGPNVVALCQGKGNPFSTGLLIAPDLVLTTRHSIAGMRISNLSVVNNYQALSTEEIILKTALHSVLYIAELGKDIDYTILRLAKPFPGIAPIPLELDSTQTDGEKAALIHHPSGRPKQVTVDYSPSSNYHAYAFSGMHVTRRGSSGGVYLTASGRAVALHCLHDNQTATAVWMNDIYHESKMMQAIYGRNPSHPVQGVATDIEQLDYLEPRYADLESWLEHIGSPPKFNTIYAINPRNGFSRNHIIPQGDMEFLWLMAQENSKLQQVLKPLLDLRLKDTTDFERTAWACWNIFFGPGDTIRCDKAEEGFEHKPINFNNEHWQTLEKLYDLIQNCWQKRCELEKHPQFSKYRKTLRTMMEGGKDDDGNVYDGYAIFPNEAELSGRVADVQESGAFHRVLKEDELTTDYVTAQQQIVDHLRAEGGKLSRISSIYHYREDEWVGCNTRAGMAAKKVHLTVADGHAHPCCHIKVPKPQQGEGKRKAKKT